MRIPIVDEQDHILYYKDSQERDKKKEITRAAGIWISNEKREFLVAKRSKNKKHQPNIWGPSAAGTLEEGETYESNIIKETKEEIGVNLDKVTMGPKVRVSSSHEYFGQYFFAIIPSSTIFTLQEEEVDEVRWVSLRDLQDWYSTHPEEFIPSFNKSIGALEQYENKS